MAEKWSNFLNQLVSGSEKLIQVVCGLCSEPRLTSGGFSGVVQWVVGLFRACENSAGKFSLVFCVKWKKWRKKKVAWKKLARSLKLRTKVCSKGLCQWSLMWNQLKLVNFWRKLVKNLKKGKIQFKGWLFNIFELLMVLVASLVGVGSVRGGNFFSLFAVQCYSECVNSIRDLVFPVHTMWTSFPVQIVNRIERIWRWICDTKPLQRLRNAF